MTISTSIFGRQYVHNFPRAGDECLRLTSPATDRGQLGGPALTQRRKRAQLWGRVWPEMKESSEK